MHNLDVMRSRIKQRRQSLSNSSQRAASLRLALKINRHPLFRTSKTFAAYLASRGEINLAPLIKLALKAGKRCFLPVVCGNSLQFKEFKPGVKMATNKFGLQEPLNTPAISIEKLDILLCPLVAFDSLGNRVGMGGGYYDRTLARFSKRGKRLWGVAHQFQRQHKLVKNNWDVQMDGIFTDKHVYTTTRR